MVFVIANVCLSAMPMQQTELLPDVICFDGQISFICNLHCYCGYLQDIPRIMNVFEESTVFILGTGNSNKILFLSVQCNKLRLLRFITLCKLIYEAVAMIVLEREHHRLLGSFLYERPLLKPTEKRNNLFIPPHHTCILSSRMGPIYYITAILIPLLKLIPFCVRYYMGSRSSSCCKF